MLLLKEKLRLFVVFINVTCFIYLCSFPKTDNKDFNRLLGGYFLQKKNLFYCLYNSLYLFLQPLLVISYIEITNHYSAHSSQNNQKDITTSITFPASMDAH